MKSVHNQNFTAKDIKLVLFAFMIHAHKIYDWQ